MVVLGDYIYSFFGCGGLQFVVIVVVVVWVVGFWWVVGFVVIVGIVVASVA